MDDWWRVAEWRIVSAQRFCDEKFRFPKHACMHVLRAGLKSLKLQTSKFGIGQKKNCGCTGWCGLETIPTIAKPFTDKISLKICFIRGTSILFMTLRSIASGSQTQCTELRLPYYLVVYVGITREYKQLFNPIFRGTKTIGRREMASRKLISILPFLHQPSSMPLWGWLRVPIR